MEIERKFLIKQKEKVFPCPFEVNQLKKDIKKKGVEIIQDYLFLEVLQDLKKDLKLKLKFKPNEIRLRKIKNKYTLTLKGKGSLKRNELEIKIKKDIYEIYKEFSTKSLKKIRLKKRFINRNLEFDYYPKYSLIVMEVEFNNIKEARSFNFNGREITGIDEYKNRNLAE